MRHDMAEIRPQLMRALSRSLSNRDEILHIEESHGMTMLQGIQAVRGQFQDIVLIVENEEIQAHRLILAACSPYFAAMFNPKMKESQLARIQLPNQRKVSVKLMLDFMYTGSVKITGEAVEDLLCTANFFNVSSLQNACCNFLLQNMDEDNCIGIMHLAQHFGCEDLRESARKFLVLNLAGVMNSEEFSDLNSEELRVCLSDEYVCRTAGGTQLFPADQEKKLCEIILQYVQNDTTNQMSFIPTFLKQVRLALLRESDKGWFEKELKQLGAPKECVDLVQSSRDPVFVRQCHPIWNEPRRGAALSGMHEVGPFGTGDGILGFGTEVEIEGEPTEDSPWVYVSGVKIFIRLWDNRKVIGGLKVSYSNGEQVSLGNTSEDLEGRELHVVELLENERITHVELNSGWLIDCLTFHTSTGRVFGPYGGDGGAKRNTFLPPEASSPFLSRILSGSVFDQGDLACLYLHLKFGYFSTTP